MASSISGASSVGRQEISGQVKLCFTRKSDATSVEIPTEEIHQNLCKIEKLVREAIQSEEGTFRNYLTVGISYILSDAPYTAKESQRQVAYRPFKVPDRSLLSADDFVEEGHQNQGSYSGSKFHQRVLDRTKRGLEKKNQFDPKIDPAAAAHTEQAIYEYLDRHPDYFVNQSENPEKCKELIDQFKTSLENPRLLDRSEREELFKKLLSLVEHYRKLESQGKERPSSI